MKKNHVLLIFFAILFLLTSCQTNTPLYMKMDSQTMNSYYNLNSEDYCEMYVLADVYPLNDQWSQQEYVQNSDGDIVSAINSIISSYYQINYSFDPIFESSNDWINPDTLYAIKNSNELSDFYNDAYNKHLTVIIPYGDILPGNYIQFLSNNENREFRAYAQLYISTHADVSFYEIYPFILNGTTVVDLWFYGKYIDNSPIIYAWTSTFYDEQNTPHSFLISSSGATSIGG